jgi:hypothetical protein
MCQKKEVKVEGCELCLDWPVRLTSRCHPTAPLRIDMIDEKTVVVYCYIPECKRELCRFTIDKMEA